MEEVRHEHIEAIPMGRLGTADEFADVVTFLCSARAGYVTGTVVARRRRRGPRLLRLGQVAARVAKYPLRAWRM